MSSAIRLLLTDDHALVREGLRSVLTAEYGFAIVGEATNAAEARVRLREVVPDVAILDLSMPGETGLALTAHIRKEFPAVRVLVLSVHDHAEYVLESVRVGAHGYLRKDVAPSELRDAVRAIARGESYFTPTVAKQLQAALTQAPGSESPAHRLAALTPREREVLQGIVTGATNRTIAADLQLSTRTVEAYRESLMRKLEIRTVAGLTRFAIEAGVIHP